MKMLSKTSLLCLESNTVLIWELFSRSAVTNTPQERKQNSDYYRLRKHLRKHPDKFFDYFNMSLEVYEYILENVRDKLDASVVTMKTLSSEEKLFITLRYLAKGLTLRELSHCFLIGCSTASKSISDTLAVLWDTFHPDHMAPPQPEYLRKQAEEYYHRWRFPNCVGAIGGKYIAVHKRQKRYRSWKTRHRSSLLIHAVVDAEFRFQAVSVNSVKDEVDYSFGGIFSQLGWAIAPDSDINLPLVIIGNKAFPLKKHLLRPFPPRASAICHQKANFNTRLELPRVTVDCAFEILSEKWEILKRPMEVHFHFAVLTVKVACLLNNIIKDVDGMKDRHFCKFGQNDHGAIYLDLLTRQSKKNNRASTVAVQIREQFQQYLQTHE